MVGYGSKFFAKCHEVNISVLHLYCMIHSSFLTDVVKRLNQVNCSVFSNS